MKGMAEKDYETCGGMNEKGMDEKGMDEKDYWTCGGMDEE